MVVTQDNAVFSAGNSTASLDTVGSRTAIQEAIEYHASQQPQARAVNFQDHFLTYLELNHRANQLAHYLIGLGVGAEMRVCVCLQPSLEISVALLGILKAGAVYVPLDPNYPPDRLATILKDTQPQVILTQAALLPNLPNIAAEIFCCDRDWQTIEHLPTDNPTLKIDLDQTAYIIYTSGTTGKPKGVMTSYRNLQHYILGAVERFGFDHSTIMPAIARFSFSITFLELLSPLVAGGMLIILEREQILDFRWMCQILEQITALHASPNLLKKLLGYIQNNGINLAKFQGLKHVSTGGDLVPADVLKAMQRVFQNAEIYVIYGCSEVSCMACSHFVSRQQPITKTLVGQPFPNVAVRLYESEQNSVPIGEMGEVYMSGAGVFKGYLEQSELTSEKFVIIDQQRWYRTGDRGRFDTDGNLEIIGRTDFQIKLNGIRIEPGEIEFVLRQIRGVREVVVIRRELNSGEPGIVAYLVFHPTHPPEIADIRAYLQTKLPDYMVPAAFVVLAALPLNLNQKVDRQALPAPTFNSGNNYVSPRNELEIQLIEIWKQILGIPLIGIKDNFFELGGHSLTAFSLVAEIERICEKSLPLAVLFQKQTIEDLADFLCQSEWSIPSFSLVPIQPKGVKPPLFGIHYLGKGQEFYRNIARYLDPEQPVYGLDYWLATQTQEWNEDHPTRLEDLATHYIAEMRTIQPQGPYFMAGLSFGGILAYEMAQQLHAQGEKVGLLVLFDTASPLLPISTFAPSSLKNHLANLAKIGLKEKLDYILERVNSKIKEKTPAWLTDNYLNIVSKFYSMMGFPIPYSLHHALILAANEKIAREYRPRNYPGEVTLFRASEKIVKYYGSDDLGWSSLAKKGVEIHEVPGAHLSIFEEPHVKVLSQTLMDCINQYDLVQR